MKDELLKLYKDCLYGLLVLIAIMICNFLLISHYGDPAGLSSEQYVQYMNKQFLLTALPAALVTFLLTGLLQTKTKEAALQHSIIWTIIVALYYIITCLVNNTFLLIIANRGIYALLFCIFTGPILYALIMRLEGSLID